MAKNKESLLASLASQSPFPVLISQAENGDIDAAQELLKAASKLLAQGNPLPEELATWIGEGLGRLAEGEDAKTAFKLKKPRGRRRKYTDEFERLVADSIHDSPAGRHKGLNADGTPGAYLEAAEWFDIAENTAQSFYNRHLPSIAAEEDIRREFQNEVNDH